MDISFCNYNNNTTVQEVREDFSNASTAVAIVNKYRGSLVKGIGAFDAIAAAILGGAADREIYQKNYIDAAWPNSGANVRTWQQNAAVNITGDDNYIKTPKIDDFCRNAIKPEDTLVEVYKKLDTCSFWDPDKKADTMGVLGSRTNTSQQKSPIQEKAKSIEEEIREIILKGGCRQIIFTGAPGTGKTYIAKRLSEDLGEQIDNKSCGFVQFHPSYDYTDFVEGLRPIEDDGNIFFAKVDGIFKAFCRKVVKLNNENSLSLNDYDETNDSEDSTSLMTPLYFFIIDEINRANLSKVFGELMFGLEKDKRGEENKFLTQYQNLPTYDPITKSKLKNDEFEDGFYIPENVVIIGTMNDIDRSVDSMDFALRRRFEWKEFIVSEDMLKTAFESGNYIKAVEDNTEELAISIMKINEYIESDGENHGLNRQYFISQGQAANLPEDLENLEDLREYMWKYRIESLLWEYLRSEDGIGKFIVDCKNAFIAKKADA